MHLPPTCSRRSQNMRFHITQVFTMVKRNASQLTSLGVFDFRLEVNALDLGRPLRSQIRSGLASAPSWHGSFPDSSINLDSLVPRHEVIIHHMQRHNHNVN